MKRNSRAAHRPPTPTTTARAPRLAAMPTLAQCMDDYLDAVALARSSKTAQTYRHALHAFQSCLEARGLEPERMPVREVSEDWIALFTTYLKDYAPASERLYLTAVSGWYEHVAAEGLAEVNLPRLRLLIRRRARRPGQRLPQFPISDIEAILKYAINIDAFGVKDERQRMRNMRDRAFLLTLADSGLRVHEACALRRGDLDFNEGRALVIGKGDRQAVVRLSQRALRALKDYLSARSSFDGASGRPLTSLPLFARHDRGAGRRVLPMTTTTGRAIVHERTREALGDASAQTITPHSFRHYFVTTVLRGSGGNLKLAQELARHRNIAITQRYAHLSDDELDRGFHEIFNAREGEARPAR